MVFGAQPRALLVLLLLLLVEFLLVSNFFFSSCGAQDVAGGEVQTARFVPLESSWYSKAFVARWNEQNAGAVGDVLQLSLVRNGNNSDGN